ncbi:hypothetical protein IEQ34_013888 [Dendrobium chrysotoxum]|uniref:DEUBAD domain-containing protein n=1 Tax=Dendrobium chrysotoxum TaxID=161865 RepID=A0AAV7GHP7_DENCH|nr:hypothetical protein IEQ34_013888 [Dendrobium chrysotoxum]
MIAIQIVNSISTKINVLRDEELWPQSPDEGDQSEAGGKKEGKGRRVWGGGRWRDLGRLGWGHVYLGGDGILVAGRGWLGQGKPTVKGSAQSNAWDSLVPVPSKKRSVINLKPSVEKLTKDLYSIWHEQQSSNLSGSSEEELLFEGETPMGSVEIGHGGVLLRYPSSKAVEEESEASSLPADKKLVGVPYSRSASSFVDNESKRTSFPNPSIDKFKKSAMHAAQDHARRFDFGVINLEVFMEHMKNDEHKQLMKYLPSIDTANSSESLRSLFSSPQFIENFSYFQQLIQDGILDLSSFEMNVEECKSLKRLVLFNFTKSSWVQHYEELKVSNSY